ncbi:MAG: L,D-transpeptidase [Verrucomicrobiales bacterium]
MRRGGSILLAVAVLAGSMTTSSALGKRNKPWKRSADRVATPTASVASSATRSTKRFSLFKRERRVAPVAVRSTRSTTPPRVEVRATTAAVPVTEAKKRPRGLFARIFNPRGQELSGNVAAARQRKYQASPSPNPVQAPPSYNHALISQAKSKGSSVVVNIARQRAYVYVDGKVAIDSPVSTARSGKRTPRGNFGVGEKVRQGKISTIYHVDMPFWMRLGSSAYGMHAGYLPGYPASAGCIRLPYEAAAKIYDCVGYGTRVKIVSG